MKEQDKEIRRYKKKMIFFGGSQRFFRCEPIEVCKNKRMKFIAIKTNDGQIYRNAIREYDILQSINSAGRRCHDNACCESMWGRMKSELLYGRYHTEKMTTDEHKALDSPFCNNPNTPAKSF